ncbi:DNA polymerase III subunit delta [Peptoniphilus indolicus]|uniref:DNA polymerase III subunit delta n=3 Tax=Peptoniphilus indolicus TaxID=33030 RepID=A0A379DE00_9FIRM|nr:DNA polymerase III subunit delta [Peptoniphilus indolicus]SUB75990.1 DNA polymerase III subunit delta [Peptoniphilus indolicus]
MVYQELYNTEINGAYLFYGSEQLMMDRMVNEIIESQTSENFRNFNLQYIDGKNLEVSTLISAVETLPVFDSKKIVIVKNFNDFIKNIQDETIEIMQYMSEHSILIFLDYEDEVLKTTKFYKYFSKLKRNVEFPKLRENEFRKFLNEYISERGFKISPADVSYLAQKSGYNSKNLNVVLYDVKNEVDKILATAKDEVNRQMIDEVYISNIDTNIFNFLDAMMNKNISVILLELNNLYQVGEPIQKIFYMVARQFRLLLSYKNLKEQGYQDMKIMEKLKIKQYEFSKLKVASNKFEKDKLKEIYISLLEYDHTIKTRTVDERALFESLLVKISI